MIDPLAYVRVLARSAVADGAQVYAMTAASAVSRDGDGWRLGTPNGTIRAGRVLMATNAFTTGAARDLGRSLVPLMIYQIATDPLPPEVAARVAPFRQPASDTRGNLFTWRLDAEDRLISGGMALIPLAAEGRMAARIVARLASELRLPRIPRIAHVWRGSAAMTPDGLPRIAVFGPGYYGATGCNGRGIAFSTMLGEALAPLLRGEIAPGDLPIPLSNGRSVPFRALARMAPSAVLLRAIVADRASERQTLVARLAAAAKGSTA